MSTSPLFSQVKPSCFKFLFRIVREVIINPWQLTRRKTTSKSIFCKITFFDNHKAQVGQGTLRYASIPFEGAFVNPLGQTQVKIDVSENWFEVLSFQAQISNLTWSLSNKEDFQLFWCPTQSKTWAISYSNLGEPSQVEGWSFGDSANAPILTIYGNRWVQINSEGKSIGQSWSLQQSH